MQKKEKASKYSLRQTLLVGGGAALLVALLDQASKHLFFVWHQEHRLPINIFGRFFRLVYTTNPGAAWGMFSDHTGVLTMISLAVLAVLAWRFPAMTEGWPERVAGLGILIGGITGNLVDRLARGAVVDFIDIDLYFYDWPVFNVADSAICVGIAIYLLSSILRRESHAR